MEAHDITPTSWPPGSAEKLMELARRVELAERLGLQIDLHHPQDNRCQLPAARPNTRPDGTMDLPAAERGRIDARGLIRDC